MSCLIKLVMAQSDSDTRSLVLESAASGVLVLCLGRDRVRVQVGSSGRLIGADVVLGVYPDLSSEDMPVVSMPVTEEASE